MKRYPNFKDKIDLFDVSTPLSVKYYLSKSGDYVDTIKIPFWNGNFFARGERHNIGNSEKLFSHGKR